MAIGVGNDIDNADYNNIVTAINNVLGAGSGDSGYGQVTGLTHVTDGTDITHTQLENLRTKLNLAINHQSGSDSALGQIYSGNIIGADASNTGTGNTVTRSSSDTFSIDNPDANKGFADFSTVAGTATTNRDNSGGTSLSTSTIYNYGTANLSYTANWQYLQAEVECVFSAGYNASSANGTESAVTAARHLEHFFNAGGKILLDTRVTNNSGSKADDWNTIIEAVATVSVGSTAVTASSGTASLSQRQLTGTYQTILTKSGSSGVYAENEYKIEARTVTNGLRFRISFNDNDAGDQTGSGPPVDESVNGDIEIRVRVTTPTSGIVVAAPSFSIPTALATYTP